ncbi:MAG: hypothetical protein A2942_05040 [Candidatus Lloydbacteria bacterium RIFCSPLOWO2_01_FULL_50_20]|uniref:Uncharacterized protein n=1 Tax=Candidatus Lloydbacteria bacterium RIFCSPLOWO2_01_FULL_50_20 TaxID=1798665 RepID=A0A1G2DBX9_9BACT|nr:MAG: hypothetical protein A3C13_01475 [Candidatus Lloydbacteria bacterium RIFCSPHIGHO2_02_FULL_50_11]OGZ11137.1 MAG: hypothetical protein A2942_05040 [Candidatus Lloydbacteria bacterium RIFCSPLOWO2_01_FULL_50_20]
MRQRCSKEVPFDDDDGLVASSLDQSRRDDPYEDGGDEAHRQMLRSLNHPRVGDPAPVDRVISTIGLYGRRR